MRTSWRMCTVVNLLMVLAGCLVIGLVLDGWAADKTSSLQFRQLRDKEPLPCSIDANSTDCASIDAASINTVAIDDPSSDATSIDAVAIDVASIDATSIDDPSSDAPSSDAIAMSEAPPKKEAKPAKSRPPKPFNPPKNYHKKCCQSFDDTGFDNEAVLKHLYGEQFNVSDTSGHGEIAVLGNQNSGTSMTSRLTALLGAYMGDRKSILITKPNPLKFWEQGVLTQCHGTHTTVFQDPFKGWNNMVGQNFAFDISQVSNEQKDAFQCFAERVMKELRRHPPSVMKDPRQPLAMGLWREHLPDLVCLIVYRDIGAWLRSIVSARKGGGGAIPGEDEKPQAIKMWTESWHTTLHFSLESCIGRPTVISNMDGVTRDPYKAAGNLYELLTRAGVRGLHMPSSEEVDRKVTDLLKPPNERPDVRRRLLMDTGDEDEEPLTLQHTRGLQANMPLPPKVVGLNAALLHHIDKQFSDDPLDATDVAEAVLKMAESLADESADLSPALYTLLGSESFDKLPDRHAPK